MSDNTNREDDSRNKRRKVSPMTENYSQTTSTVADAAAAALAAVTNSSQVHINNNNSRPVNIRPSHNIHNVSDSLVDVVDPSISGIASSSHHDLASSLKNDQFSEAAVNAFANQFSTATMHASNPSESHARNLHSTHLHHHIQQQQQQQQRQNHQGNQTQIKDDKHGSINSENGSYNSNLLNGLGLNATASPGNSSDNLSINNSGHKAGLVRNSSDPLQGKKLKSIEYKSPIYKKFMFVPLNNKYWTKSIKDENKYLDFEIQCIFEDNCNWKSTLSSNKGSTTNLRRHLAKAHHVDLKMFDYQNNATGMPQYIGSPLNSQHNSNFASHLNGGANNIMNSVASGYELMDSEDRYISLQRSQSLVLNFMAKSGLLTSAGYMSNNNLMFDDSLKELVKYFSLADTNCTDWKRQLQLKALSQIDKINN